MEDFTSGGELQALERGHFVRELVDRRLLEAHLGHEPGGQFAQLRRVEFIKGRLGVEHGTHRAKGRLS